MSTGGVRFTDGFDRPDTIAFGLDAPRLITVVSCALCAYGVMQAPLPLAARVLVALLLAACGAVLGWARYAGRPVLHWLWLALRFALSPRSGGAVVVAAAVAEEATAPGSPSPADSAPRSAGAAPAAPSRHAGSVPRASADLAPPARRSDVPEWMKWLELEDETGVADVEPARPGGDGDDSVDIPHPAPVVVMVDEREADLDAIGTERDPGDPLTVGGDRRALRLAGADGDAAHVLRLPVAPPDVVAVDPAPDTTGAAAPVFVGAPRRVTFFSLNGGSGRTTLATEVAAILAARGRHLAADGTVRRLQVALLDLDMRSATVAVRLGVAVPTLADYLLRGGEPAQLDGCMVRHRSGLRALLGPPKPLPAETVARETARVAEIVHRLERDGAHFVVIDTGSDLDAVTTWVLSSVHDIFVVITPTASGVQDAYRTTEALRRLGLGHKLRYVVNRARTTPDLDEVMGDLGGRIAAVIPDDPAVEEAENTHRIAALETDGPAAAALHGLAALLYPSLAAGDRRTRLGWLPWRRRAG